MVLTFRKPVNGCTMVPLRGGDRRKDLRFEPIIPGGPSRIAVIAAPLDTETDARNERWTFSDENVSGVRNLAHLTRLSE